MAGLLARVSWSSLERCARWDTSPVSGRSARSFPGSRETVRLCTRSFVAGWMRSSLLWMRSSLVWMRSSLVVWPSDCQCRRPGFDPRILRYSGIWGATDEAVMNTVHREKKIQKIPLFIYCRGLQRDVVYRGWPTAPSYMAQMRGKGWCVGDSANECRCTKESNKLWRSNSIFNLWSVGFMQVLCHERRSETVLLFLYWSTAHLKTPCTRASGQTDGKSWATFTLLNIIMYRPTGTVH